MDYPDDETSSSESLEEDGSKNGPSKRDIFLSTYHRYQNWSLPESIVYYMAMNPKNAEVYEKLIRSCKYFFVKNPILIAERFAYEYNDLEATAFVYKDQERLKFPTVLSKFWITDDFENSVLESSPNMVSSLLPKFYRVDVKKLTIYRQDISFDEFLCITSNVEEIHFRHTVVKNKNGTIVPFEKLLARLPKLDFVVFFNADSSSITSKTAKEVSEILQFSKVEYFELHNLSEVFDIENFLTYMKKSKGIRFILHFCRPLSEAFKNRLEEMIDEIIDSETCGIYIRFDGLDEEKHSIIQILYYRPR
uniref:DUF38 domain-containing protein n=1 Tax=Panagrolaimus sp. ES5 TaxID=591445 RepID=A0AC34GN21_9BILA